MKNLLICMLLDIVELFWKEAYRVCSYHEAKAFDERNFGIAAKWTGRAAVCLAKGHDAYRKKENLAL